MNFRNTSALHVATVVAIGAMFFGNGCMVMSAGYFADPAQPVNVTAVAGDSSATVSWEFQLPEPPPVEVLIRVQYASNGGIGEQCTRYEPAAGCTVGCEVYGVTAMQCVLRGLTSGNQYTFTVIALTSPPDRTEGASSQAYARSGSVTINAD